MESNQTLEADDRWPGSKVRGRRRVHVLEPKVSAEPDDGGVVVAVGGGLGWIDGEG